MSKFLRGPPKFSRGPLATAGLAVLFARILVVITSASDKYFELFDVGQWAEMSKPQASVFPPSIVFLFMASI
jgi:hypothetical protein